MSEKKERRSAARIVLLAVLIALVAAALAVGVAYGRQRKMFAGQMNLRYGYSTDSVYILEPETDASGDPTDEPAVSGEEYLAAGDWSLAEHIPATGADTNGKDVYQKTFLIANSGSPSVTNPTDQKVGAVLFITEGAANDQAAVRLEAGGIPYTGVRVADEVDDSLKDKFGPGYLYRFTDSGGEPLAWDLKGGVFSAVTVTVTVWCRADRPAAFYLLASSYPS